MADRERSRAQIRALPVAFADDQALVRGLCDGHPAAARVLWDRFAVLVRRLLQRTLARDDVDDAVQDSFIRLYTLLPRLRDPNKLRSFVVGVTMRVAREQIRHRRIRRWLRFMPEVPERPRSGADYDAAEALAHLDALLQRLDADTRIVFVLRFIEDVPTSEIAEVLDCSLATAKRRVRRARSKVERIAANDATLSHFMAADVDDEPAGRGGRG